jgi:uncharacterized protein GlcG (DUF336 family)
MEIQSAIMSMQYSHRTGAATQLFIIPAEGVIPVLCDGMVIGGIRVSGVRSFQDGQIAQAGVAALD